MWKKKSGGLSLPAPFPFLPPMNTTQKKFPQQECIEWFVENALLADIWSCFNEIKSAQYQKPTNILEELQITILRPDSKQY